MPGVSFGRASLDPYRGAIPNGVGDVSSRNVAGLKIDGLATSIQPTSAYGGAGSVGDAPEPDVVEEFRLVTNQDAENGGDLGTTVQLVTKSGTNQYHGTVWEYLRNNALDSRNFLAKTVAPDKENEFGAAVGGPIIKRDGCLICDCRTIAARGHGRDLRHDANTFRESGGRARQPAGRWCRESTDTRVTARD